MMPETQGQVGRERRDPSGHPGEAFVPTGSLSSGPFAQEGRTQTRPVPAPSVRISIIISTRNRAELLRQCLEALLQQNEVTPETYEIIVVDNGSTDHTRQVVAAIRRCFARTQYLYEERLGLSVARNAGVRQACGEFICFTDDDAIPAPTYVAEILSSFTDPQVACVGGRIIASWPQGAPPGWFPVRYANVVGQTSFGDTARRMNKGEFPFGGNIAFRRKSFEALGGFAENLGKRGENNVWGEEIDLCHRLQKKGLAFFYNPRAVVRHVVGPGRANQRHFVDSVFGKGVTEGYQKLTHRGKGVFTLYLLLKGFRLATTSICYLTVGAWLSEAGRFRLRCAIAWYAGYLHFLAVREDLGSVPRSGQ
jgi:glycosyltransferase involved in cell wall biosynthesis